jgi:hypothetical protein
MESWGCLFPELLLDKRGLQVMVAQISEAYETQTPSLLNTI